jgi:hypothetical protein
MKSRILGAMAILFAGAGWAAAQAQVPTNPPPPPGLGAPAPQIVVGGNQPLGGTTPTSAVLPNSGQAAPPASSPAPVLGLPNNSSPLLGAPAPGISSKPILPSEAVNGHCATGCGGGCIYGDAEYLIWRMRNGAIPTTATVAPIGLISVNITDRFTTDPRLPGTPAGNPLVGFAPVSIRSDATFGQGHSTGYGDQNGARFTVGYWADADQTWGLEGSFFFLERGSDTFSAQAAVSGNQFVINTGFTQNVFLTAGGMQTLLSTSQLIFIRETTSQLRGSAASDLMGAEVNGRCVKIRYGCVDFGCLAGFRYINFTDTLAIDNNVRLFRDNTRFPPIDGDTSASLSQDLSFRTVDRIHLNNDYFAAQIGADIDAKFGSFYINCRAKYAFGVVAQSADVTSLTRVVNNDPASTAPQTNLYAGGLLAGPNDIGHHSRTRFAAIPEVTVKFGYQVTEWLRAFIAYDALYLSHMARAGNSSVVDSLNTTVSVANSTNQFSVSAPTFRFKEQDVWVQGASFGIEINY